MVYPRMSSIGIGVVAEWSKALESGSSLRAWVRTPPTSNTFFLFSYNLLFFTSSISNKTLFSSPFSHLFFSIPHLPKNEMRLGTCKDQYDGTHYTFVLQCKSEKTLPTPKALFPRDLQTLPHKMSFRHAFYFHNFINCLYIFYLLYVVIYSPSDLYYFIITLCEYVRDSKSVRHGAY